MEAVIIAIIVGLAFIYLVKRYLRIFRPPTESSCDCGCSDCSQVSSGEADIKTIQPRP